MVIKIFPVFLWHEITTTGRFPGTKIQEYGYNRNSPKDENSRIFVA
nr:MAG TPA: hypothetical protein [Caudoviricetes sp.]